MPPTRNSSASTDAAKEQAPAAVQPVQPQTNQLVGAEKAEQHDLLARNTQEQSRPHPEATVAGIHSTGSYTADEREKPRQ